MRPGPAVQYVSHRHGVDMKQLANFAGRQVRPQVTNQLHARLIKSRRPNTLTSDLCSVQGGIGRVVAWWSPAKIAQMVVQAIAVAVACVHAVRARANKSKKDRVLHKDGSAWRTKVSVAIFPNGGSEHPALVGSPNKPPRPALYKHAPFNGANAPVGSNLVSRNPGNVAPFVGDNGFSHEAPQLLIGQRPVAIRSRSPASLF